MAVLAIAVASGAAEAQSSQASQVSRPHTIAPPMLPLVVKPGGTGGPVEPREATVRCGEAKQSVLAIAPSDKEKTQDARRDDAKCPAEQKPR